MRSEGLGLRREECTCYNSLDNRGCVVLFFLHKVCKLEPAKKAEVSHPQSHKSATQSLFTSLHLRRRVCFPLADKVPLLCLFAVKPCNAISQPLHFGTVRMLHNSSHDVFLSP